MILRDPATGLMARPAPRAALIIGGLSLLLMPAWAPGRPPGSARPVVAAQAGGSASLGARQEARTAAPDVAEKVAVSQPLVREVSDYEDFAGRVEAAQTIEIRARVSGILVKVPPRAELVTEKAALLFEIDPRPYQADLDRADAEVKLWEVQLKSRSAEVQRAKSLRASARISQEEFDRIEEERDKAQASLQAARATRELVRLKLDSTKITAPIRGKLSRPRVAEGDLVVADTTVLATIDSSDPMYVGFNVDERTVLRLGRERREGQARSALESGLPVLVGLTDEEGFPRRGRVDSVDTRLDPATNTLRCHAAVPNPDGLLLPGLFARIRLITSAPTRALLVAEGAVLTDQGRKYVFVVDDRGVIERRPVKLGEVHDGLRAVKEGLKDDEWVVVDSLNGVKSGMTVKPERVTMPRVPPASARDARQ
jgi:multidrug efflux system membrane fusion protein